MRSEAARRKKLLGRTKSVFFTDERALQEPAALLSFLRLLAGGPIVPTPRDFTRKPCSSVCLLDLFSDSLLAKTEYKRALTHPTAAAHHLRRHDKVLV